MTKKKVAVIGSGIAGSGIAALLAHSGKYEVDLYEKNKLVGGRFASYVEKGFRLDVGCHMIANGREGTMGQILKLLGRPDEVRWREVKLEDSVFHYRGQSIQFPVEIGKMGLTESELQKVLQFFGETLSIPEDRYEEYDRTSMLDHLERTIKDERVRTLFAYLSSIYFVTYDDETPVGEWARCSKQMMSGQTGGYPIGGTGAIPQAYVRILEECGGRFHRATPVRRILVEGRAAKGVELADGARLQSDLVISNAGLKPTVTNLVGPEHYPRDFIEKVRAYTYSHGWGVLRVALDEPVIEKNLFFLHMGADQLHVWGRASESGAVPDRVEFMMVPIISNLDPSACPEGRQLLIAGGVAAKPSQGDPADRDRWRQAFLNGLESLFPGFQKHLLWATYTSPADIDRLFGEDGAVIGIAQKIGQVGKQRPPLEDPAIRNLYHCSADSGMHGIGGELAADSALRLFGMLAG